MSTPTPLCPICGLDSREGVHQLRQELVGIPCKACGPSIAVDSIVCVVGGRRVAVRCSRLHDYAPHFDY